MQFGWFMYVTRSAVTSAEANPTNPVNQINPTNQTDLTDPTNQTDLTDLTNQTDLTDLTDPTDPIDLTDPINLSIRRTAPPLRAATSAGHASG
jgi:hypothetical protein